MSVIDIMSGDLNFFLAFNGSDKQERERKCSLFPPVSSFSGLQKRWLDGNLRAIAPLLRGRCRQFMVFSTLYFIRDFTLRKASTFLCTTQCSLPQSKCSNLGNPILGNYSFDEISI